MLRVYNQRVVVLTIAQGGFLLTALAAVEDASVPMGWVLVVLTATEARYGCVLAEPACFVDDLVGYFADVFIL